MLAAATGEHSVLVEVIIHLRGHQTRQRIAEQRRKLEYAQTQPIQQIIHRKRRDRREQVFENDRINADGVAHGVEMAAGIIGKEDFLEIYVSTPLEECERRDVKGLYAKARRGEIKNFTGISAPFEAPAHPALSLDTSKLSLKESVDQLLDLILPKVIKK